MITVEIKLPIGVHEIQKILPHCFPSLLIDRVTAAEPDKLPITIKNIAFNEQLSQGHLPEPPVVLGILIVEAMAQIRGVSAALSQDNAKRREDETTLFAELDNVCFKCQIASGDQLVFDVELLTHHRSIGRFNITTKVSSGLACEAAIICTQHIVEKG